MQLLVGVLCATLVSLSDFVLAKKKGKSTIYRACLSSSQSSSSPLIMFWSVSKKNVFFCFVLSAVSETNNVSVGFTHNVLHYTGRFTVSIRVCVRTFFCH